MQRYQNSLHFKFFPISVEGGGHRKSIFSQIQKSPNYPRGGGGQENYGLFPQIMVFFILNRLLIVNPAKGAQQHVRWELYHRKQSVMISLQKMGGGMCSRKKGKEGLE